MYMLHRCQEVTPILWQVKQELRPMSTGGTALIASSFRTGNERRTSSLPGSLHFLLHSTGQTPQHQSRNNCPTLWHASFTVPEETSHTSPRSTNSSSCLARSSSPPRAFQPLVGRTGLEECRWSSAKGNKEDRRAEFLSRHGACVWTASCLWCLALIFSCKLCTSSTISKSLLIVATLPPPRIWASGIQRK